MAEMVKADMFTCECDSCVTCSGERTRFLSKQPSSETCFYYLLLRAEVEAGWEGVSKAHAEAMGTLVTEREAALARVFERNGRTLQRIDRAFCHNRTHEVGVLRRTFGRVQREAAEGCARQSAPLLAELVSQLELHAEGRLALHGELAEAAEAVRLELTRLAADWRGRLDSRAEHAQAQLGRLLVEQARGHLAIRSRSISA